MRKLLSTLLIFTVFIMTLPTAAYAQLSPEMPPEGELGPQPYGSAIAAAQLIAYTYAPATPNQAPRPLTMVSLPFVDEHGRLFNFTANLVNRTFSFSSMDGFFGSGTLTPEQVIIFSQIKPDSDSVQCGACLVVLSALLTVVIAGGGYMISEWQQCNQDNGRALSALAGDIASCRNSGGRYILDRSPNLGACGAPHSGRCEPRT